MGDLYAALSRQVSANAQRVVDSCVQELPEYRAMVANPAGYAQAIDFAVSIRRRSLDLAASDHPLTEDDLAVISALGEERAGQGMSQATSRRILALHAAATLREIQEASRPNDLSDAMHVLSWLGSQATIAQQAYNTGFLQGQKQTLTITARVREFTELALAGDPAARRYAENISVATADHFLVVVVRTSGPDCATSTRSDVLDIVWHRHRAAATWHRPDELVALLSADRHSSALAMVRDVADVTGRPCAAGAATGPLSELSPTHATARRVSQVARAHARPDHLHTVADVFIEIGVAQLPDIDQWLHALTQQLAAGPDLLPTLETYYRHDLDRARTATTLSIHPGTLDYRLGRAHELTGIDPRTTHGIRVFTTALALNHRHG